MLQQQMTPLGAALPAIVQAYAAKSKSENTLRAYRSDWGQWCAWCAGSGHAPLPASPEAVATYIAEQGGVLKASTIDRRLDAISVAHKAAGYQSPTGAEVVRATLAGVCRTHGTAQVGKRAITVDELRRMVDLMPETGTGVRDRAIVLLGFAGALRRSEIVALTAGDIEFLADGARLVIRKSKTDQEGQGQVVGIPYGQDEATCPVRSLKAYIGASGAAGLLFPLSDRSVANIVKKWAGAAGMDPDLVAGHSLRSGLATAARKGGADEYSIMRQGRWKSRVTVQRYIREADLFHTNAAAATGL
jgi:integrase